MATRPLGTGYDPNSGWPPDDSTNVGWYDTDLYGNFGPGGFAPNPKMTGPVTGTPPGLSLSGPGGNGAAINPDQVIPPENSTIPNMKSVGPFTGGSATDAIVRGASKYGLRRVPGVGTAMDLVSPTDELAGPTGVELPRTLGRSPSGPARYGPPSASTPPLTPFTQPAHPSTMRYPMWSTPPAPAPSAGGGIGSDARFPVGPPITAPAMPPVRPRVAPAGPAAAQQQPNLGNYAPIYQPNIARTGNVRGGRSGDDNAPLMGAPDWSRLFGRQP
jgi:hypothetical protein